MIWSSPLLLLVLVFSLSSSPSPTVSPTTTTTPPVTTTTSPTTTTSVRSPSTSVPSTGPTGATGAGDVVAVGQTYASQTPAGQVGTVTLRGPGAWRVSLAAGNPVLTLHCGGAASTVTATLTIPSPQDCQLVVDARQSDVDAQWALLQP